MLWRGRRAANDSNGSGSLCRYCRLRTRRDRKRHCRRSRSCGLARYRLPHRCQVRGSHELGAGAFVSLDRTGDRCLLLRSRVRCCREGSRREHSRDHSRPTRLSAQGRSLTGDTVAASRFRHRENRDRRLLHSLPRGMAMELSTRWRERRSKPDLCLAAGSEGQGLRVMLPATTNAASRVDAERFEKGEILTVDSEAGIFLRRVLSSELETFGCLVLVLSIYYQIHRPTFVSNPIHRPGHIGRIRQSLGDSTAQVL